MSGLLRRVRIARTVVVSGSAPEVPLANPRARKMMSRAAYLAARGLADLVREVGWDPAPLGYYLGVGASGGSLVEFMALLGESLVDGAYSLPRFGERGLAACNPLLAFQLMNNFTLCHGAILEGMTGPNGAVFSRGAGTVAAMAEAVYAVASGECDRAITGGADAATHPATIAELARDGFVARGLRVADGAGLLALEASDAGGGGVTIAHCAHASGRGRPIGEALVEATRGIATDGIDVVAIAPWGPPAEDALRTFAARYGAPVETSAGDGETLAASAALAVIAAADRVRDSAGRRALVLTLGVDGDPGAILLEASA